MSIDLETAGASLSTQRSTRGWNITLWVAQVLLAIPFGMAGVIKTFWTPEHLVAAGIGYATALPFWMLRFIGISELLGTIGVILPALTRVRPRLTVLAALGLATIQVLAIGFHAMRHELAASLPINLLFLSLSLFVVWGRACRVPITPRD